MRSKINSAIVGFTAAVIAIMLAASCRPYEAAWRTASAIKAAAEVADRTIARQAKSTHDRCLKAHQAKTQAYKDCMHRSQAYKALRAWRDKARPTINAALIATVTALQIAEKSKGGKLAWQDVLRPAACALSKIVSQFSDLLGDHKSAVMVAVKMLEGVTCE